MSIWFSSDLHLGHANIIRYTHRPFRDVKEMDETLIANWNDRIKPDDTVYFLGDFCFGHRCLPIGESARRYLKRLNGHIHFIRGNHDREACAIYREFKSFNSFLEISPYGQDITLCHYALRTWPRSHYGSFSLYGHSHGTLPDDPNALAIDVGVDCHGYAPVSFEAVKEIMAKKKFIPIDHHGRVEGGGVGLSREEFLKLERQRLFLALKQEFEPGV